MMMMLVGRYMLSGYLARYYCLATTTDHDLNVMYLSAKYYAVEPGTRFAVFAVFTGLLLDFMFLDCRPIRIVKIEILMLSSCKKIKTTRRK